jgi:predicted RND superfamily exporter protein
MSEALNVTTSVISGIGSTSSWFSMIIVIGGIVAVVLSLIGGYTLICLIGWFGNKLVDRIKKFNKKAKKEKS